MNSPSGSARFFEKQLRGEEPPSFETGRLLSRLAGRLQAYEPWKALDEDHLVFVRDPASGEVHACSVMGARGEFFALAAYLGNEGYQFFRKLQRSRSISAGDFFAEQHSVRVEYVRPAELEPPDRKLLAAVGHPNVKGGRAPMFRSIRPGFHAWFVTEGEARILIECLLAMIGICEMLSKQPHAWFWGKDNLFPFLSRSGRGEGGQAEFTIEMVNAPGGKPARPAAAQPDQQRVRTILNRDLPQAGTLEVDHFYSAATVGRPNERKACVRLAIAVDGESGFAYPPETAMPGTPAAELLMNSVLSAVETGGRLPREVRVRNAVNQVLLRPLAAALGFELRVTRSLPALDPLKRSLLDMMGDAGAIPLR